VALWVLSLILGTAVFVPLFVIALVRFTSARVAFVVSASFSIGAMLGFFLSLLLAYQLNLERNWDGYAPIIFASAGALGGAALALALLRRFAGNNWQR
jgi:hypothetical protein